MLSDELPYLSEHYRVDFPQPDPGDELGIVLVGGNLSPGMLLSAYEQGVFPWYGEDEPILWWNPPLRCVLFPGELHLSRSTKKFLRTHTYQVTRSTAFRQVIKACREIGRPGQEGTWITTEITDGYTRMHELGFAVSYEVWNGQGELAGGLYGMDMGSYFCGESMFSFEPNTSKLALYHLHRDLCAREDFRLIDFQVTNPHSESLGAREISRSEYLRLISR